ncbi:hypothetical protein BJX70DRAFT_384677, partial [Aspergillus crustosus]
GSLLALRSYLEGLKAGLTLRLIVQILFKIEITALLTIHGLIFEATNQQALDIRAFKLQPFDKICHAITYAADSFDERGYRVCDEHGNKVDMSA